MRLAGARTLVTGASGGLGEAIARACAERGATVIVSGRREGELRAIAAAIDAQVLVADLADEASVEALADQAGAVDVLVSNAALPASGSLASFTDAEIDRALAVNVRAPMILARHVMSGMAERRCGHLVFVSSLAAAFPTPGLSIYNATKAALTSYALSLRAELADHDVGVSVVHPGPISQAGMWAETGLSLPFGLPTRSPAQVGAAVVAAIETNRAQVAVAPYALRLGATLARTIPATSARVAPRLGARRLTEAMANALRDKR